MKKRFGVILVAFSSYVLIAHTANAECHLEASPPPLKLNMLAYSKEVQNNAKIYSELNQKLIQNRDYGQYSADMQSIMSANYERAQIKTENYYELNKNFIHNRDYGQYRDGIRVLSAFYYPDPDDPCD